FDGIAVGRGDGTGLAQIRAPATASGGDDAAGAGLTRCLADRHGGFTADLLFGGDLVGQDVALVDPDLDADAAEGSLGLAEAVVDVRPQGVQRPPPLPVELPAGHLGAAQATGALDTDALG